MSSPGQAKRRTSSKPSPDTGPESPPPHAFKAGIGVAKPVALTVWRFGLVSISFKKMPRSKRGQIWGHISGACPLNPIPISLSSLGVEAGPTHTGGLRAGSKWRMFIRSSEQAGLEPLMARFRTANVEAPKVGRPPCPIGLSSAGVVVFVPARHQMIPLVFIGTVADRDSVLTRASWPAAAWSGGR